MKIKASLAVFIMCLVPAYASYAQAVEVAKGVATSILIQDIVNGLNSVISRAEKSGDFVLKRTAQETLYIIDGFQRSNKEILQEAFEEIGDERKAVLNQVVETTNNLTERIDLSLDRAESMLNQFDRLARDVTFKNYPVIFRYQGGIVIPGETQSIRITVQGANLTNENPFLVHRNTRYEAKKLGENLLFEIPRDVFLAKDKEMVSEVAELNLVRRYGGFFGFFEETEVVTYDLNIVTMPNQLGVVELEYKKKHIDHHEKPYAYEENHNSSSRSWDCRSFSYSPVSSDRRFDADRSSVTRGNGNSRGELRDIQIKDTGISFRICAKRNIADWDNGFRHAQVRYVEVWSTESYLDEKKSENATWTSDIDLEAGKDTKDMKVRVSLFTGRSVVLTKSDTTGMYGYVTFDEDMNTIIFKPKIPQDLKRL